MYIGILVKYHLFLSDFNETWIFFRKICETYSDIKFHEYLFSGSRVVTCEQTDRPNEANITFSQLGERRRPPPQKNTMLNKRCKCQPQK